MKLIHIDDYVSYRPGFGADAPRPAKVQGLTLTKEPRDKYGVDAKKVSVDEIIENRVVFSLDDGHWAYSDQIDGYLSGRNLDDEVVPIRNR